MSLRPFRLRVLDALTETIERVNPDNGHQNDLRGAVFRGRSVYSDTEDPLPMVSIMEPPIPLEGLRQRGDNRSASGDWELLIQGFVKDDRLNPTDPAHILMAEVKVELVKEKRRDRGNDILGMGGKVMEMQIGQGAVRPPDEVSSRACYWMLLTLKLAENLEDPYA